MNDDKRMPLAKQLQIGLHPARCDIKKLASQLVLPHDALMSRYHTVAVLMGGISAEREVSLASGQAVALALEEAGYTVHSVDISERRIDLPEDTEAVFNVLHGEFGEDGEAQTVLRELGIPSTGASVEASRLAFDKFASKEHWRKRGLPTPDYELYHPGHSPTLPFPFIVKPARQGSSVGIHRVTHPEELDTAISDAIRFDDRILIESYIAGRELTVGVLNGTPLPVLEIRAPDGNYDYRAKYTAGLTEYLVPAPLPAELAERCQELAREAFLAMGCDDIGRVDFRMNSDQELYILELNTIPGFTATSLLPKAAAAAGINFVMLCDQIIRGARVK